MGDLEKKSAWLREQRARLGWSGQKLAARARAVAEREGNFIKLAQQQIASLENLGRSDAPKRVPVWFHYVEKAIRAAGEADLDPILDLQGDTSNGVLIERLPTFAGAGGGGTGEEERQLVVFSRDIINEIGAKPEDLLLIEIEGDSLAPEYLSGDKMLANKRKVSLAQPGAFCLWDGDGYVVKYLEKVPGSDPPRVRVISGNPRYSTFERLIDEITIMGRIEWFARRV